MANTMTAAQATSYLEKEGVTPPETLALGEGSRKMPVDGTWRADIDTSTPFESVKEAVDRFGGSAVWKSQLKQLCNTGKHNSVEEIELLNVKEQSAQLSKDLIAKEQETLDILNELETTRGIVSFLNSQLHEESSESNKLPKTLSEDVKQSPGSIFFELKQAKMNLFRTTSYIAGIRATIESFTIKVDEEKSLLQKNLEKLSSKRSVVSSLEEDLKHFTLKLQLIKEKEAAKSSEIEQMKATIKAHDSLIVLSIEEYAALTRKVEEGDEFSRKKIEAAKVEVERANQSKLELLVKIEEAAEDVKTSRKLLEEALSRVEEANRRKCAVEEVLRRSKSKHYSRWLDARLELLTGDPRNEMKHTLSIGEILDRKLTGPDDYEYNVGIRRGTDHHDKGALSLGQIINRRSRVLSSRNGGGSTKKKIKNILSKSDFCSTVTLD